MGMFFYRSLLGPGALAFSTALGIFSQHKVRYFLFLSSFLKDFANFPLIFCIAQSNTLSSSLCECNRCNFVTPVQLFVIIGAFSPFYLNFLRNYIQISKIVQSSSSFCNLLVECFLDFCYIILHHSLVIHHIPRKIRNFPQIFSNLFKMGFVAGYGWAVASYIQLFILCYLGYVVDKSVRPSHQTFLICNII